MKQRVTVHFLIFSNVLTSITRDVVMMRHKDASVHARTSILLLRSLPNKHRIVFARNHSVLRDLSRRWDNVRATNRCCSRAV